MTHHQEQLRSFPERFKTEMGKVIVGQQETLDLLLIALLCEGHVLLTGVPGLAKTLLIKTLAQLCHLDFKRIQCTPDLMPSDITGVEVLDDSNAQERQFRFLEGPVFTNLLLADEINRTSPRTQSALLQAMQEKQVTVGGKTRELANPFVMFATQNPIDSEGTYPLPEAQLDRFLLNVHLDYPPMAEEVQIATASAQPKASLEPLFQPEELLELQKVIPEIPIADYLVEWIVNFVRMTRPQETQHADIRNVVEWGAGVRASQSLVLASKARAALAQRSTVHMEDILFVLAPILRHRIIVSFTGEADGWNSDRVISVLLKTLNVSH